MQCATLIGISNKIRRLIGRGSGGFWPNEGMEQPMERQAVFGISNHPGLVRRGVRLAVLGARRPCPFVTRLPSIRSTLLNKPNRRILRVQNRSSESVGFRGRRSVAQPRNRWFADLYGSFSVKWFFVCCRFLVWSGKAVPRPVACDQVRGARGRCQGTEMLAQLSGLPLSVACVSQRLDA